MIALGPREAERGRERLVLLVGARLDQAGLHEPAQHRRVAVVAEPARVHRRRHEVVAERVHRHERGQPDGVAEVVAVGAAGERRAGRRLGGEEAHLRLAAQHAAYEREGEPREVRAAAHAAHDHVGLVARHLHLLDRLLADHRLVEADVVEHRAERVVRALVAGRDLDRLRDGYAERAGRVRRPGSCPPRSCRSASGSRLRPSSPSSRAGTASGRSSRRPCRRRIRARTGCTRARAPSPTGRRRSRSRAASRPPPCSRTPARRRCSACASRPARRPRTCSRCAPAYRARARAGARGRAAWAARSCTRRERPRGSRPPARPTPPGR